MNIPTCIQLESSYKANYLHFMVHLFLGMSFGPLQILIIVSTSIANKIDDPISWLVLILIQLFFSYFSYGRFKYLYYTYFKEQSIKIDYENKSILYFPYQKIILTEEVTAFIYNKEFKRYIFRYKNHPADTIEVNQNTEFENALLKFPLECKTE